jgi:hypothetical protein
MVAHLELLEIYISSFSGNGFAVGAYGDSDDLGDRAHLVLPARSGLKADPAAELIFSAKPTVQVTDNRRGIVPFDHDLRVHR